MLGLRSPLVDALQVFGVRARSSGFRVYRCVDAQTWPDLRLELVAVLVDALQVHGLGFRA